MLSDLLIVRLALRQTTPDLSRHAAMQCSYGRFKMSLSRLVRRISGRLTAMSAH